MARVSAARPITRRVAGVHFRDGQAETDDPGALAYFRRRPGYTVEDAPKRKRRARKPKQEQETPEETDEGAEDGTPEGSDGLDEFRPDADGGEVQA